MNAQVPGVPIWEMIGERDFLFPSSRESVSAMVIIDHGILEDTPTMWLSDV